MRMAGKRGSRKSISGGKRNAKPPTATEILDTSEATKYDSAERLVDEGYERWQTTLSKRKSVSLDPSLVGLPTNAVLGDAFMYRLNSVVGAKRLQKDFFLLVEENQTPESSLWLLTRTPWLRTTLTLIALHTQRKTRSPKTRSIVSIKSGREVINVSVQQDPKNESVLTLRFAMSEGESDGR
jgi:hypothetical protein